MKSSENYHSIVWSLLIFCLVLVFGCSAPAIKIPQPLPAIVREYKHLKLYGNRPGMKNTGIFLHAGDTYSILATGIIDLWPGGPSSFKYHDVRPEDGWPLMMRIGKTPYTTPLRHRKANTLSADCSGDLYLGVRDGKVDLYGESLQSHFYEGNAGFFEVHILVWTISDYDRIADFFKEMKELDSQTKVFDDAYRFNIGEHEEILDFADLTSFYTGGPISTPILTLETGGHMSLMKDVIFTREGKYLVSASTDKTVRVWEVSSGEMVRVIRGQIGEGYYGMIFSAALSPDDRFLATGVSTLGVIRIIDFNTGQIIRLLRGHKGAVVDLAFSPDGGRLISGSTDRTARIWDIHTGKTLHVLQGHLKRVQTVAFSHDGTRVASGSWDNTLKIWNARTGHMIKSLTGHRKRIFSVAFTSDGKYLLSGSVDHTIRLWNASSGEFIKVLARYDGPVKELNVSAQGDKVIAGGGGRLRKTQSSVYSISSGTLFSTFAKKDELILATAIAPNGNTAAIGTAGDLAIYLWDVSSGRLKQEIKGKGDAIWSVGFSKDGRFIAWGKKKQRENVFSYGPLEQAFQIKGERNNFALGLGRKLSSESGYVRALADVGPWSIRTKTGKTHKTLHILLKDRVVHKITRGSGAFYHGSLTITPDGKTVISGGFNGRITSYDIESGLKIYDFWGHTHDVNSLAVSPDSRFLVSGSSDQTVKLWEVETGKLLLTIFHSAGNEWIAWTPDGYYTASPRGDNFIGWHLNNGENKIADYYSAFQFERIFYRPDYVHTYLKHSGDRQKVEAVLKHTFFDIHNLRSIAPPKINIISPSYGQKISAATYTFLKFSVDCNSIEMLDFSVFVNNIPVIPYSERILKDAEKSKFIRELQIPLLGKKNRIRIEAFNGKSMGVAETVVYKQGIIHARLPGNLYLLAVGVNHFKNMPWNNLEYAASDAINLAEFFSKKKGHFNYIFTKVISDYSETKPSKNDILDSLDFIKNARGEDTVILFLASHGLSDTAGNYYFVPGDAKTEDLEKLINSSGRLATGTSLKLPSLISWEAFFEALRSTAGKRLLVVDTCQAKNISGTLDIHSLAKRSATSSFALLAASRGDEESQEYPQGKQGLFTYALLKGLSSNADRNADGRVALAELYDFVAEFVEENRNKNIGKQTPQLAAPRELEQMVLTVN